MSTLIYHSGGCSYVILRYVGKLMNITIIESQERKILYRKVRGLILVTFSGENVPRLLQSDELNFAER